MSSRITSNMLSSGYLRNMKRNLTNMQTLQNQLASGKEIQKASDNPYKASRSMQLHAEISSNTQYNENIKDTSNWLDTTDTALSQMGNVFGRIETLLVNAGNGAYGEDERIAIQDEVKEKVNELSQILNTSFDGSYIFGGTKTGSKPTTVVNGVLQYANSDGSTVNITAYKDSTTGNITSDKGLTNTSVGLLSALASVPATDPTPALNAERDNSATSTDRKEDITKILQGATMYYNGTGAPPSPIPAGQLTSEPYTNKEITLSATDITKLQKELDGLDYTTSSGADFDRINDINSLLYNNTGTLPSSGGALSLADIKSYQQNVKNSTATKTEVDALNSVNKVISINQTNSDLNVDISQGVSSTYNKNAIDIMEFTDKSGNTINVSELLSNVISDLGSNGNTSNLTASHLKDIQSVTANLLQQRSEVGSIQNRMDSAQTNNETQNYNMTDILSKTEDIDFAEKTMEYSMMQTVYTAALQTSAKILPMTILTYL